MPRVFLSSGDVSGDRHAARLVRRLGELVPDLVVEGLGGPELAAAGMTVHHDLMSKAVFGIGGAFKALPELLGVLREVYTQIWGKPPEVTAIHAGLECGLLGEKKQGLDMVSFGPQITGAHSPDERVNVPSVERFWRALTAALAMLGG